MVAYIALHRIECLGKIYAIGDVVPTKALSPSLVERLVALRRIRFDGDAAQQAAEAAKVRQTILATRSAPARRRAGATG